MLLANDRDGARALASPGAQGTCPGCEAEVIAKCGEIVTWHWSHRPLVGECDPWWEESAWHLGWKAKFPQDNVEVVIGPHRADVKIGGLVIEFQHSSISAADVREREDFYGNMVWVFDVREAFEAGRLDIRTDRDDYLTFRWNRPWAVIGYCRKPVFLDLGDGTVFELRRFHLDRRPAGWGYRLSEEDLLLRFSNRWPRSPLHPDCSACGRRWFQGHAEECPRNVKGRRSA